MAPRLRNSSRAWAKGSAAVHSRNALAVLAAWRRRRGGPRINAKLSKLCDDDPCRCRIERRNLYWRALEIAARYGFPCGGCWWRTDPLLSAEGKAKSPRTDRESEAERRRTAEALRMTVEDAAAALAGKQRPHYGFEQELAAHIRRRIWLDLTRALFGSSLSPGRPGIGLFRPRPTLVSPPGSPFVSRQSDCETEVKAETRKRLWR
jgi:hypothetical protein